MRVRALVVAGLSAALLTACGGGSVEGTPTAGSSSAATTQAPSGPELAAAAADALEQAGAVRMTGTMAVEGQAGAVDLHLQGADAAGTMTVGGQTVELIVTGGALYLRAPADFWAAQGMPDAMAPTFASTWIAAPAEDGAGFGDFSLASFVSELRAPTVGGYADGVERGELDGQPVWLISQGDGSLLRIAAEGTPYPLQGSLTGPDGGTVTFSEFGVVQPITAPADYVDLGS